MPVLRPRALETRAAASPWSAQEVRALAQRSANAAKEIKDLISTSRTEVESGVKLVGETGETLNLIIERVGEIDAVVADIASGAADQATALQGSTLPSTRWIR